MTTDRTLADLARAWLAQEEGAGTALWDRLEETGWQWDGYTLGHDGGGKALAGVVPPMGNRKWYWTLYPGAGVWSGHGWTRSRKAARAAAELALRRALRA
jgi:hypothetical protein